LSHFLNYKTFHFLKVLQAVQTVSTAGGDKKIVVVQQSQLGQSINTGQYTLAPDGTAKPVQMVSFQDGHNEANTAQGNSAISVFLR
jgi:hypothetical protein